MDSLYQFDREFRLKILALCLDDTWMARYGNFIIQPNYFERDDEIAIARAILEYREKFNESPEDPYDVIALTGGEYSTVVLDIYEGVYEWELQLASDIAVQFAREQAAKLAILDSVDDVNSGNIGKAIERMKEALKVGEHLDIPWIDPVRDIDKWLYDYWSDKVPTRLLHVDNILEGGLGPEELGVIMAPSNRGKSMSLVNIGYGAANIGSGRNVVHFVHEMSQAQTAKRYAARMTFRFPKPGDDLDAYAEEIVIAARKLMPGKIRIIGGAKHMTTDQIRSHCEQLKADEFDIGMIIDDYPDLLEPPRRYSERRFELTALFTWFRELAGEYSCPIWVASQSNRDSFNKEIVTMADVAEDIGKANVADVVVSVCQTYEEEQTDTCRLFMAKVRDGSNHALIRAKYFAKQQAIITTGLVERNEGGTDA